MAHKYFDPVREDVEKELAQHRPRNGNSLCVEVGSEY